MQRMELTADRRERAGKGVARSLRREGKIPAVLYGAGKAENISLNPADLLRVLRSASGENALINLKISGGAPAQPRTAIIRDYQKDPLTGGILHADLFEIDMNKTIRIKVPIVMKGDQPAGVKEGGVLQHNLREVEIECLPSLIPDNLAVDASRLNIGESVHVRDLHVDSGVRILEDLDLAVVSIAAPMSEAKLEQILAGTPAGEAKEPELIGKKKEEEEAAAAEGAAAKPGEKTEAKAEAKAPKAAGKEEKK